MSIKNNEKAISWILGAIVALSLGWVARSVDKLNTNVARLLERSEWHHQILSMHDQRIQKLEGKHEK